MATIIIEVCALVAVGRVAFAVLQWLSRTYVLTTKRIIRIRGVFTIDIFQCALVRVQNTFLVLTLLQRLLNLGNIELTTAGTGSVEAIWRHCKDPLGVHQQLLQAINRASNPPAGTSVNPPTHQPAQPTNDETSRTDVTPTRQADKPTGD